MEGIIANYRRGVRTMHESQMIVEVKGTDSKQKASALAGKTVTWATPSGRKIKGKVLAAHGGKGAVRVKFEQGLPGAAVGTKVLVQ